MDNENKLPEMLLRLGENGSKILDTFTKAGVAYLGYKSTDHWSGALTGLIALRLATGGNLAGGLAGTAVLTTMGLAQIAEVPDITKGAGAVLGEQPLFTEGWLEWLIGQTGAGHRLP